MEPKEIRIMTEILVEKVLGSILKASDIRQIIREELDYSMRSTTSSIDSKDVDIIDVQEAAKVVRLSVNTMYQKVQRNEIPYLKRDNKKSRLLFSKEELLKWVRGDM